MKKQLVFKTLDGEEAYEMSSAEMVVLAERLARMAKAEDNCGVEFDLTGREAIDLTELEAVDE